MAAGEYLFFVGATIMSILLLRERRWIGANLVFLIGVVWVLFFKPLEKFFKPIGIDSLSEAGNFDWGEAVFYLETIQQNIEPNFSIKRIILYVATAIVAYIFLRWIRCSLRLSKSKFTYVKFSIAALFMAICKLVKTI